MSSKHLPLSSRYRVILSISLVVVLTTDILARLELPFPYEVNHRIIYVTNFIYFIFQPLPVSLSLMYLFSIYREKRFSLKYHLLFLIPFFIGLIVMVYSHFTDFIFFIDEANVYHRGPGMFIYGFINYSFAIPAFGLTFHYRDTIKKRTLHIVIAYTAIPYIGSFLQLLRYGIITAWPSFTLAVLITYVFLEVQRNERDYLTGLLNRQNFDIKVHNRMEQFAKKGSFSLVVIDLNDFKMINDLFGHDRGDKVLQAVACLLTRSVSMADTVARYGGDEFVLILDTAEIQIIKTVLRRIDRNIESWNEKSSNPFTLSLSAGYAVYNPEHHPGYPDLFKEADAVMFDVKQEHKKLKVE